MYLQRMKESMANQENEFKKLMEKVANDGNYMETQRQMVKLYFHQRKAEVKRAREPEPEKTAKEAKREEYEKKLKKLYESLEAKPDLRSINLKQYAKNQEFIDKIGIIDR